MVYSTWQVSDRQSNENIYFEVIANCDKNIVSYAQKLVLQNKVQQTRNFLLFFFFFYKLLSSVIVPGLPDNSSCNCGLIADID